MTYSYTQIRQYLSCPRRYRHRYLDGWQEKDTRAAMLFGRAFEQAVAALFRWEDPTAVLFEQWGLCKDMGLTYSGNDTWDRMLQQGIQLLQRFAQDDRVRIRRPRSTQQIQFNRTLGSGDSFVAYVDAIGELDGTPCVLEWKTTSARYPEATRRHFRTGSATRLLFLDDRHRRSRPDRFRAQAAGRSSVPAGPPFLTNSGRSSQPWSRTPSDGSSPGSSCRTAASAFHRIPAPPALSSASASTSATWSRPAWCANQESILVCLTNFRLLGTTPMPPKLNRKRALFVLTKIDEILAWEQQKEMERDTRFVELGRYLCEVRAGQYWRLENLSSFDEFLTRRFPESRRKAYYLMSIHEYLPPQARKDLKEVGWTKGLELAKLARRDGQHFDCATWLHKARALPKEDFRREVEKELTGKETEPSELIYFKVYKSQIPVIEQAIETAALMLGTDKSRGYCLEMICADFLAGAHLDNGNPEILLNSISRYYKFLPGEQQQAFLKTCERRRPENGTPQSRSLPARLLVVRKSAPADPASRRLAVSILWHDVES